MKREHIFAHYEQDATRYWKLREGGYASPMSVFQGEEITFHISNSRSYYDVYVYHEGARRRLVKEIANLRGALPPIPGFGYRDGFDWPATVGFRVPADWKSGVYIAGFPTAQGIREILFVVRPRVPSAPMLLTIETNTYAAYNPVGGKSLFHYLSTDRTHSDLVTFERPLQPDIMGGFYAWDQFITSWLDAEGYAVDYCVNADHDREPELLDNYPAHLRIGHGEYTSREECEQLQRFVARGGNLIVLAGNSFSHLVEDKGQRTTALLRQDPVQETPAGHSGRPAYVSAARDRQPSATHDRGFLFGRRPRKDPDARRVYRAYYRRIRVLPREPARPLGVRGDRAGGRGRVRARGFHRGRGV